MAENLPLGVLEYHHILLPDQGWVYRGRKVIAHLNPVSELDLDKHVLGNLTNSSYGSDYDNILIDGAEHIVIDNDVVEDVVVEDVVEDVVDNNDVIEDVVEDNSTNDVTNNWFNEGR